MALCISTTYAQDPHYVDSLEKVIRKIKTERRHDTLIVNELNKLAYHHWGINPKKNEAYAKQMLQLSQKNNYLKGIARAYTAFGITSEDTGNFSQAVKWHEQALEIRKKAKLTIGIADCYNNIALVYIRMGLLNQSLENFLAALKTYESIHDTAGIARIYGNIGLVYHSLQKYDEEIVTQRKAQVINLKTNNTSGLANNYSNIGNAYIMKADYKNAFINLKAACTLFKKVDDLLSLADTYNIMGLGYYNQQDFHNAQIYYGKAREIYLVQNNAYGLTATSINLGNTYGKFKDYNSARTFLEDGLRMAKASNTLENIRAAYEGLSTLDTLQGNYKSAFKNYELFIKTRDSIVSKENTEKTTQTRMEYQFDKERELTATRQTAELRTRNLISISLCIGLVFIVSIALLLYRRSKFMKKVQAQTQQNLEEKEILLREIHHRVKNNLAVISGLLYLQKNRVSDETIKRVLLEGQNRIDSMVLVHEMLYQSNNIAAIDLKSYLNKLITQITHGFEGKSMSYTIDGTATLEPKQAVPLGLILTELVTNIYKYAYPDQQAGVFHLIIEKRPNDELNINLKDQGKGLPKDFDVNKSKTLGLKLVKLLCQQMKAELSFSSDNGTAVALQFNLQKDTE